ncbi:hypothetical protein [Longimicrobium sp.]|jgi:hypothetical protein|uniref:hypothetical protein n=1 Tax=Longimicrobium sp. TaxID=2029185 RepID=UPI002F94F1E2
MTATLGSSARVPPSRSATYSMPRAISLPYGSFSTSAGVSLGRSAWPCTPIQRAVCTDPSWLMNDTQASLARTFCGTPRFGTTITPRSASYEQLSAEKMAPNTFTLDEIASNSRPGVTVAGMPSGLPTE